MKKWLVGISLLVVTAVVLVAIDKPSQDSREEFSQEPSQIQEVDSFQERSKSSTFFGDLKAKVSRLQKEPRNVCLTNEEYEEVIDPNAPVLSIPFDPQDYSTKYWGIVPFCANLRNGSVHGALDFELKPNSKVFAATDGVVKHTEVGQAEGSGEIIAVEGDGFSLDYSGLTNLQVKAGDKIKRGDYIANAVRIPHGEYHVHLGINTNGKQECPLKYMDDEFLEAFKQMFAQADYRSQTNAKCACDCESIIPSY